jgi:hypothetical protein
MIGICCSNRLSVYDNYYSNIFVVSQDQMVYISITHSRSSFKFPGRFTRGPFTHLTSVKVVDRIAVRVEDTEAWRLVVVLVRVPEDVHLVEGFAGNRAPEGLSIFH